MGNSVEQWRSSIGLWGGGRPHHSYSVRMGNSLEQWRSSIGLWGCGRPRRSSSDIFQSSFESVAGDPMLNYFMLAVLAALLVIAGVEMNPGPFNKGKVPTTNVKRYDKTTGRADMSGELYEVKVAALLFGRALNRGGDFHLASNMKAAEAFDDIVLRLGEKTLFLQLKHRTGKGKKIYRSQLVQLKGDFSLLKYYKSYCEVKQQWAQNKDLQQCGRFEDSVFIIYTNVKLDCKIILDDVGNTDAWYSGLSSGGKCLYFTKESHADLYQLFQSIPTYIRLLSEEVGSQQHKELLEIVKKLWNNEAKTLPDREELNKILRELKSIGDVSDHEEFLSRLRFCTGEAAEKQLDDLIRKEIKTAIGKDTVYDKFLAGVQNWWRVSNYFLSRTAYFLLEIRAGIISEPKLKQLGNITLSFRKDVLDRFKEMVPPVGGFLHIITKSTVLTTLKVHQSLAGQHHLLVDGNTLCAHQSEVLALWGRWCDLLVVVDDGKTPADFLCPPPGKILVYISGSEPRDTCTTLHDEPDLRHLDDASQTRVLDTLVHFQGYDVALREISGSDQHLVPPDVIIQLLTDKQVLGDDLTYEVDYYVPRSLRLSCHVRNEVLSHRTTDSPVTFAVSGLSHAELQKLLPPGRGIPTLDKHVPGDNKCKVQNITTEDDFLKLTESCKTVHWLHREGDVFLWKQSRGDMSVLMEYLKDETCQFGNVDSVMDISHRVALVSAEPGMGKSTLLTHLALGTKWGRPSTWVVRINLNDFTQQLDELPKNFKFQDAMEFLLQVSGIATEWKPMFRCKLATMENVCVLFDGYDEISPTHSEKVVTLLKLLQDTKLQKLWVTTRPVMREELERELSTLALTLQPFSGKDQRNFLTKYWRKSIPDIEEPLLNTFITELLNVTARNLNDKDRELMGIPLQSVMLAEAFEKDLRNYSETRKLELPHKLDLLQMYTKFVDRKFEIYYEKNKVDLTKPGQIDVYEQWGEMERDNHMVTAVVVLLPPSDVKKFQCPKSLRDKCKSFTNKIERGKEKIGIIKEIVNETPVFIHRTFAEYFAALWFARNFENLKSYLSEKLFDSKFQIVRNFFDLILAQNFPLHFAVLKQDKGLVQTLVEEQHDVNERDKGGRTTLHLAVTSHIGTPDEDDDDDPSSKKTMNEIMEILLEHGADPGLKDEVLCSRPLRIAERIGAWSAVDMLLGRRADSSDLVLTRKNISNEEYDGDVLIMAARQGLVHLVTFMLQCGLSVGRTFLIMYGYYFSEVTLLHESAKYGQVKLVEFLLDKKADVEARDNEKRTALMWAAEKGRLEVVELLIQRGASVTSRDENGNTALLVAAIMKRWDVFRLLSQQKDTDVTACDNKGSNALHLAAQSGSAEMVARLLDMGIFYIDCRDKGQETPLLIAASSGRLEVTQLLCERCADLNAQDSKGLTPLHAAARDGQLKVVKLLIQRGSSVTSRDKDGNTALLVAAKNGHWDVFRLLSQQKNTDVTACDNKGDNALHFAAYSGSAETVAQLLDIGMFDIDCRGKEQKTPLLLAAYEGRLEVTQLLCERGADLNVRDNWGGIPLLVAARNRHWDVFRLLSQQKDTDVTACDNDGENALHIAAWSASAETVAQLLDMGIFDIDCRDKEEETPLCIAAYFGRLEVTQLLCERGADLNARTIKGWTPLHAAAKSGHWDVFRLLSQQKDTDLTACDNMGSNALHFAAWSGYTEMVAQLLDMGIYDIDCRDKEQWTPLRLAALKGQLEVTQLLCERDADLNAQDIDGWTPLHAAAYKGHLQVVKVLVINDASLSARDKWGHTPLDVAVLKGRSDVPEFLRSITE